MKKILILLIVIVAKVNSQVGYAVAPLEIGNLWVYEEYDDIFHTNLVRTTIYKLTDTVRVDSVKYFEIQIRDIPGVSYSRLIRLREDSFYVARRDSAFPMLNNEEIYYKKNAQLEDSWQNAYIPPHVYNIIDTSLASVFGRDITIKLLNLTNFNLLDNDQVWCEEFGMLAKETGEGFFSEVLKGCVIDGIVYGDTLVTDIDVVEYPSLNYILSQNYPNPFNSTTIIEYEIKTQTHVRLSIFNSVGELISISVNEEQSAGNYKIYFKAEELASGVYFYKLTDNSNSIIKKMILQK